MTDRVVVVTGASSGIGSAAARELARRGATVVPIGHSAERTAELAASIGARPLLAEFADLDSVREAADVVLERHERIDVLVNNAGGLTTSRTLTADGHETTLQVNHLAPFLLTNLLRERLASTAGARVVTTASSAYAIGRIDLDDLEWQRRRWNPPRVYGTTKLMNILFTRELIRRWGGSTRAACFHPGAIATNFASGFWLSRLMERTPLRRLLRRPDYGAEPLCWLAMDAKPEQLDGAYYHRFHRRPRPRGQAGDAELAERLWDISARLVGLT